MIKDLRKLCEVEKDRIGSEQTFILTFRHAEGVIVTVRVVLDDSTGADLVITNMTTLPEAKRRGGYGKDAVRTIPRVASESGFTDVRAVQVQEDSKGFWTKMGFVPLHNHTDDFALELKA